MAENAKAVWKYAIPLVDHFIIDMPNGAQPLCVMMQNGEPQLWALVDPSLDKQSRVFRLAGTGHPITERNIMYIGSFQTADGALVFHVFEVRS